MKKDTVNDKSGYSIYREILGASDEPGTPEWAARRMSHEEFNFFELVAAGNSPELAVYLLFGPDGALVESAAEWMARPLVRCAVAGLKQAILRDQKASKNWCTAQLLDIANDPKERGATRVQALAVFARAVGLIGAADLKAKKPLASEASRERVKNLIDETFRKLKANEEITQ